MLARSPVAPHPYATGGRWRQSRSWLARHLLRRLWLPAMMYRLLPVLYLGLGSSCLASALLLPEPTWVLPYVALVGLVAIHTGYHVAALRRRARAKRRATG